MNEIEEDLREQPAATEETREDEEDLEEGLREDLTTRGLRDTQVEDNIESSHQLSYSDRFKRDLEQANLRFMPQRTESRESWQHLIMGFRQLAKYLMSSFRMIFVCFYHIFTTLIFFTELILFATMIMLHLSGYLDLNYVIWLFVALTMLFFIIRILLLNVYQGHSHILGRGSARSLGQGNDVLQRIRSDINSSRRRQAASANRNERDYHPSVRRTRSSNGVPMRFTAQEIELAELSGTVPARNQPSHSIRRSDSLGRPIPQVRLSFGDSIGLDVLRRRREQRLRDEELLRRIIIRFGIERNRTLNNQLMQLGQQLQIMQLQNMGRDFNENDYDVLSQLDTYYTRQTSERIQMIISQLPTYNYQLKPSPRNVDDQDAPGLQEEPSNTSDEKMVGKDFDKHSCSICIEPFQEEDIIKILPCFHQFHAKCVDDWLLRKSNCPVCKFDIDQQQINEAENQ